MHRHLSSRRAALATLFRLCALALSASASHAAVVAERTSYHAWQEALRLRNPHVEVIAVPAVGRVLSFRFHDGENVFWEDFSLRGKRGDASGKEWVNFGGDKTWPAPEAEWKKFTGSPKWMPPAAFDALPVEGRIEGNTLVLISPDDAAYHIRTIRRIALAPDTAEMTIETTYERTGGTPAKVAIWVITQFTDPVAVYVPVGFRSLFPAGHYVFGATPWPQLTATETLLRVTRDPKTPHKLGSDADRMLWIGETALCLVSTPRVRGVEYPDRGASAEVYTNPDPKTYVELETLGPLALLHPGDRISQTNTYQLQRRRPGETPEAAAKRTLGVK